MNDEKADKTLTAHRELWAKKPALREIYTEYFNLFQQCSIKGKILEIGGGGGNLKGFLSDSISVDIVSLPWLDAIADAQILPFRDQSFSNIVMVDVLHHIEHPAQFFFEADRILIPGGRIICIEPAITPISWIFLSLFHPELINMKQKPFDEFPPDPARKPFDANQAVPTLIFKQYRKKLQEQFPDLKIITVSYLDLFAYPLSGGFRPWCLVPGRFVKPILKMEKMLISVMGPFMAFRLFCVVEKEDRFNDKNQHK